MARRATMAVLVAVTLGVPGIAAASSGSLPLATTVAGRLASPSTTNDYTFTVSAGQRLLFTVTNTTAVCSPPPPYADDCPIYGTLLNAAGMQVGGEGSFAGTGPVGYAGTDYNVDTIDWTFATAGTYSLAIDGNGIDESGETPSYTVRADPQSPASGGSGGGSGGGSSPYGTPPGTGSGPGAGGGAGGAGGGPSGTGTGTGTGTGASRGRLLVMSASAASRSGWVTLRVRCAGPAVCSGRLGLVAAPVRGRLRRLSSDTPYRLGPGRNGRVTVRLNAAARRVLAAGRALRTRATVTAAGRTLLVAGTVTVRPAAPGRRRSA